jgi:hypothetical protein
MLVQENDVHASLGVSESMSLHKWMSDLWQMAFTEIFSENVDETHIQLY